MDLLGINVKHSAKDPGYEIHDTINNNRNTFIDAGSGSYYARIAFIRAILCIQQPSITTIKLDKQLGDLY